MIDLSIAEKLNASVKPVLRFLNVRRQPKKPLPRRTHGAEVLFDDNGGYDLGTKLFGETTVKAV